MGYMGFGMQSNVYKRRPKKPFAEHNCVPTFSAFKKISKSIESKKDTDQNKYFSGVALILLFIFSLLLCINFGLKIKEQNQLYYAKVESTNHIDIKAFNFLIKSGKSRLMKGNIKGAYSEFELASRIHPHHQELQNLILETLSILCTSNEEFCAELDGQLMNVK